MDLNDVELSEEYMNEKFKKSVVRFRRYLSFFMVFQISLFYRPSIDGRPLIEGRLTPHHIYNDFFSTLSSFVVSEYFDRGDRYRKPKRQYF